MRCEVIFVAGGRPGLAGRQPFEVMIKRVLLVHPIEEAFSFIHSSTSFLNITAVKKVLQYQCEGIIIKAG